MSRMTHKYLGDCGFNVFEFGKHDDGIHVDVSNGDGDDVVTCVTPEQCEQIQRYIDNLEAKVQNYIERHYWTVEQVNEYYK